jgi:hypothetical protein
VYIILYADGYGVVVIAPMELDSLSGLGTDVLMKWL